MFILTAIQLHDSAILQIFSSLSGQI